MIPMLWWYFPSHIFLFSLVYFYSNSLYVCFIYHTVVVIHHIILLPGVSVCFAFHTFLYSFNLLLVFIPLLKFCFPCIFIPHTYFSFIPFILGSSFILQFAISAGILSLAHIMLLIISYVGPHPSKLFPLYVCWYDTHTYCYQSTGMLGSSQYFHFL